ncbi:hypothetical protein QCA50_017250 [Cerrena zonata]|uniref:Nudix hydrolase domain-containing protein n=1 Tax=Cerrena zonata TaxID=2478898 RepID=A0AAW0FDQ5_9APHY
MLDNTVAGGLGYPHGLWETVVKECYEEGGLPPAFVEPRAKPTGVLLYIYQQQGEGSIAQPEVEYIYDLPFDDETSVVPKPVDGEAESFVLMDVQEILLKIMQDMDILPQSLNQTTQKSLAEPIEECRFLQDDLLLE